MKTIIIDKLNFGSIKDVVLEERNIDCLECISHSKDNKGYTRIKYNGKPERLFRVLYIIKYGDIPQGMLIRHKCDNPWCCNINHLEIGTNMDNINDMKIRGRSLKGKEREDYRGSKNGSHKLSEKEVEEIYLSTLSYLKLSKIYNVSKTNIFFIKKKKGWQWLTNKLD